MLVCKAVSCHSTATPEVIVELSLGCGVAKASIDIVCIILHCVSIFSSQGVEDVAST